MVGFKENGQVEQKSFWMAFGAGLGIIAGLNMNSILLGLIMGSGFGLALGQGVLADATLIGGEHSWRAIALAILSLTIGLLSIAGVIMLYRY